jgi:hypothetical protein
MEDKAVGTPQAQPAHGLTVLARIDKSLDSGVTLTAKGAALVIDDVELIDLATAEALKAQIAVLTGERDTLKASAAEDKVVLGTLSQQVTDYQRLAHDRKVEADALKARCDELEHHAKFWADSEAALKSALQAAPTAKDGAQ